jgi:parallel beta-helix repeat protein
MKRTVRVLCLMLLATPLSLVGCGDSEKKPDGAGGMGGSYVDGAAGTGGARVDGAAGAGGARLDGAPVVDSYIAIDTASNLDTPSPLDTTPVVDAGVPDAPLVDTKPPVIDTAVVEAQPVDTTPAIDTTPIVCTETTKFSGGNVAANRTLTTACSPYAITDDINVASGATLTIEPGVTVKFASGTQVYIYAGAIFNAIGTATAPIVFTSSKSVPAEGDWQGVVVQNGGNSVTLKYVTVAYAGYSTSPAIDISNAKADIENCIIHDNADIGVNADGALAGTRVLANTFYSNGNLPLVMSDHVQADTTNTFHSGTLINSKQFVSFSGDFNSTRTLDIIEVPYLFASGTTSIRTNANVTVNAGVTLSFGSDTQLYVYAGAVFTAVGTATSPVTFTSSKAVPAQGDWDGLSFQNGASSITIKYATIQYAGFGSAYAVDATNSTFDIENCTIQHNLNGGVDGGNSSHSTLKNNTFTDNNADGTTIYDYTMIGATTATISGNTGTSS